MRRCHHLRHASCSTCRLVRSTLQRGMRCMRPPMAAVLFHGRVQQRGHFLLHHGINAGQVVQTHVSRELRALWQLIMSAPVASRCCYQDACLASSNTSPSGNKNLVFSLRLYTFTNSCGLTYLVSDNRFTLRHLRLWSPCFLPPILVVKVTESCITDNLMSCYSDECNGQRICAKGAGGVGGALAVHNKDNGLTGSCKK